MMKKKKTSPKNDKTAKKVIIPEIQDTPTEYAEEEDEKDKEEIMDWNN